MTLSLLLGLALLGAGVGLAPPPPAPDGEQAPVSAVRLAFEPPAPVKGRDATVKVLVDARDDAGRPLADGALPVLGASCGTLGPVTPGAAPGRFEATWRPADTPQPEVLGLVALVPRCPLCPTPLALGVAALPVAAAIELPGRSDPGVLTHVEIAGRVFGPVRADGEGRFSLPVVVPPGTRWAQAISRSALGNERRTRIDLHLPEGPGLHCIAWPARVPADGRTEAGIHCVGWTASGGPLDAASLRAGARRGAIEGISREDGAWGARYRPPRGGIGEDRLACSLESRGGTARTEFAVGLAPGAPASIEWRVEGEPVVPGQRVRVSARVLDANGDPLGDATVDGHEIVGGELRVRGELGDGVQRVTLRWTEPAGDAPATLALGRVGDPWVAFVRDVAQRPVAGVPLRFGSGAAAVTDARGEARVAAKGPTETVEGPAGLRAAGQLGVATSAPPIGIEREGRIALRPAGTFDVEARVEGGWIRWIVRGPDGAALPGRAVGVTSGTVELGPVERDGEGGRCAIRRGKGSVALEDSDSGATALLEVR